MKKYYVNMKAQTNGDHEMHVRDCEKFPNSENAKYLGEFSNCQDALKEAKKIYPLTADGCWICCRPCHKS